MPQQKLLTLAVYDISQDRARNKVGETCKDFGLVRFQFSAFQGLLTRNRREELALKLEELIAECGGRISLIPICKEDCLGRIDLDIAPVLSEDLAADAEEVPRLVLVTEDD